VGDLQEDASVFDMSISHASTSHFKPPCPLSYLAETLSSSPSGSGLFDGTSSISFEQPNDSLNDERLSTLSAHQELSETQLDIVIPSMAKEHGRYWDTNASESQPIVRTRILVCREAGCGDRAFHRKSDWT
jgi:hypothetical protein